MGSLSSVESGAGGEIQLTDAIAREIVEGRPVHGLRFAGERFDCGSKAGFLQATVAFGLQREDLHDDLANYLRHLMGMRSAAE
jgi:UTP--glucose-1-phosphate uridylyltransferase